MKNFISKITPIFAKHKTIYKVLGIFILIILLAIFSLTYVIAFNKIVGNPVKPFYKGQTVISEKLSYLFSNPQIGDRITFSAPSQAGAIFSYIGVITDINSISGKTIYTVSSSPAKNNWQIEKENIDSRIYYPFLNRTDTLSTTKEDLNSSSNTEIDTQNNQQTELPTTLIDESGPTPTTPSPMPNQATPSPTIPSLHSITINGTAYEDRNGDQIYSGGDVTLQYMQFYLYDSYSPSQQLHTIYSDANGNFTTTLNVRSSLILKPTSYNNFRPIAGNISFSSNTDGIKVGFVSTGTPTTGNNGLIEGDIYNDTNHNNTKDNGEESIYFYKIYLKDSDGNYYNSSPYPQATDQSGHFKYQNLPLNKSYTLTLSVSDTDPEYQTPQPSKSFNLTSTHPQKVGIQIPVIKN